MNSSQYLKIRNSCTIGKMLKWIPFKIPLTQTLKLLYILNFSCSLTKSLSVQRQVLHFTVWRIIVKVHNAGQGAEVQQDFYGRALTLLPKRKAWESLGCRIWQFPFSLLLFPFSLFQVLCFFCTGPWHNSKEIVVFTALV